MNNDAELLSDAKIRIADHLPRLARGNHKPDEGKACAMEVASWLAGEPWSDHPRSVHPVIAHVARRANDSLDDDQRQQLWPLILASLGTARPHRPVLSWRLEFTARRLAGSLSGDATWEALLAKHARLTGHRPISVPGSRFATLNAHLHS
jgi:hypothetical protein